MDADSNNDIEERASAWLIQRDSGNWTKADQARLTEWLEASTRHRITFLRLELAWESSARLKALGAGVPGDLPPPPGEWNLTPSYDSARPDWSEDAPETPRTEHAAGWIHSLVDKARSKSRQFVIAASVLLSVATGFGAYHIQWRGQDFATPIGGLASVPMVDGSKITLNTDSQVRVKLSQRERRIELDRGEAFFEVTKDRDRPFVVQAGGRRVVAVGTKFSVRRDGEALEVTVTEGIVKLDDTVLTVGMIARESDGGVRVERKSLADAELQLSWLRGVLMFRDLPLSEAVAEINRYNTRKLVISNPTVGALRVEGNFRPTNLLAFVRLLETGFPVRVTMQADRIVLDAR